MLSLRLVVPLRRAVADKLPHVYGALSAAGSRWPRRVRGAATAGLLALVLSNCGAGDIETPGSTEPAPTTTTTAPSPTEPDPTRPSSTAPEPTESAPTEQGSPTESNDMSQSPAPSVLTDEDDGRSVVLPLGSELSLRLDSAWVWDEPAVQDDAVALARVDYLVDPGFMEWIVTAQREGTAAVTVTGEPNCNDISKCPSRAISFTIHVTG